MDCGTQLSPTVKELILDYNPAILQGLGSVLQQSSSASGSELLRALAKVDRLIPGAGLQFVIWHNDFPLYPFPGWEYDAIARPMRYIPELLMAGMSSVGRFVTHMSGGHLEDCVKEACERLLLSDVNHNRMPLGALATHPAVRDALGAPLCEAIHRFARTIVNTAKHDFDLGTPGPVIPFHDSLGAYFVSRFLGAQALEKGAILDGYVEAIREAREQGRVYWMPVIEPNK